MSLHHLLPLSHQHSVDTFLYFLQLYAWLSLRKAVYS